MTEIRSESWNPLVDELRATANKYPEDDPLGELLFRAADEIEYWEEMNRD